MSLVDFICQDMLIFIVCSINGMDDIQGA